MWEILLKRSTITLGTGKRSTASLSSIMNHSTPKSKLRLPTPSNTSSSSVTRIDKSFSVPYRHRVWFCDDVFGDSEAPAVPAVLKECFADPEVDEDTDAGPAKVQIWIDNQVANANPQWTDALQQAIEGMLSLIHI